MRTVGLLLVLGLTACGPTLPAGVRRAADLTTPLDLGCVQSVLDSTPGVGGARLSMWRDPDDLAALVQSFDVQYAGEPGALQIVSVPGGIRLQQLLLRGDQGPSQVAIDRARPLMRSIERRLAMVCRAQFVDAIHETCTAVACPELADGPPPPPPDADPAPTLVFDRA